MGETSVTISGSDWVKLTELAEWSKTSVAEVLRRAIEAHYSVKFWDAVNADYAALRSDPAALTQLEAERRLWENTLMDGLDRSERWNDDGTVKSITREECPT